MVPGQTNAESGLDRVALFLYWFAALVSLALYVFLPGSIPGWVLIGVVFALLGGARLLHLASRSRSIARAAQLAYRDALTGLPNRRLFTEKLEEALGRSESGGGLTAVMFLDLDRFKLINDTLGHAAGDRFLIEVSGRLNSCMTPNCLLARLGGDEFTVLCERVGDYRQVTRLARRMLESLDPAMEVDGHVLWPRASIGIAFVDGTRARAEDLLSMADAALYQAKERGRGQFFVYEPDFPLPSIKRFSLERELRSAVQNREICLVYQPEVSLRTLKIVGAEALVRWRHPRLGLLAPADFLPLAEESGVIDQIGEWVMEEACRQARLWRDLYGYKLDVSVNLSSFQFRKLKVAEMIFDALLNAGVDRGSISVEITEATLMENQEHTTRSIEELRRVGVRVAIDDFGTGFSSLSYLKQFKVDTLKIDRSFVRDAADRRTYSIIESIVGLGHALEMRVCAEGIETMEQLRLMSEAGCDRGQGFVLARPVAAADLHHLFSIGYVLPQESAPGSLLLAA
jgi:diguanylate cyclase (GGDEF)-like protein